uniref:Ammonium_transp domain-containing protein n=2 Tax=Caenorhabditis tropicalis TaxID=1561998 RepID=A0A1I7TDR6_9PELO
MNIVNMNHSQPTIRMKPDKQLDCNLSQDDGVWMMASSFIIFTMTAGFGLLESGRVSSKDEVNCMVKNVFDVIFGGLAYWMFGYGLTFGDSKHQLGKFFGFGDFFFDPERVSEDDSTDEWLVIGSGIKKVFFVKWALLTQQDAVQFVTHSYEKYIKVVIFEVHLVGGISGLVATLYLKPRRNRFAKNGIRTVSDPTKAILGFLMIWWGWLAFNTSSNYAVTHGQWTEGMRSAVGTILASAGGGVVTVVITRVATKKIQMDMLIDGMLASLVASTGGCLYFTPWQATLVGAIGSSLALAAYPLTEWLKIDDPVGVFPVHVVGSIWGMIAPAIFVYRRPMNFGPPECNFQTSDEANGLLYGGGLYLLFLQSFVIFVIATYSAICSFIILFTMHHSPIGLRVDKYQEELGADLIEHGLAGVNVMTYTLEKKLDTKTLSAVLMIIVRWRAKAKLGAKRRKQVHDSGLVTPKPTENVEMNVIHRRHQSN